MEKYLFAVLLMMVFGVVTVNGTNIQKLAQDTQRFKQNKSNMDMIWWMPNEYWEYTFKANPVITPEQQAKFIQIVDDYLVFAMLEGEIGMFGSIKGTPKKQLMKKASVIIDGKTLTPLADKEVSEEARNFFQMMKPMFARMLGQMGKGMEFIIFKGKDSKGKRYANPKEKGFITVKLGKKEFKYRLPLGCFLPSKYDPKTNEEFPGNYIYSPFTGSKLVTPGHK